MIQDYDLRGQGPPRHLVQRTYRRRRPRWAPILVVVALAAATIVAVPSVREPVLRAAGWALVVNEPLAPADIIVVSLGSGGAGALEAADLVCQRGWTVQDGLCKPCARATEPAAVTIGDLSR